MSGRRCLLLKLKGGFKGALGLALGMSSLVCSRSTSVKEHHVSMRLVNSKLLLITFPRFSMYISAQKTQKWLQSASNLGCLTDH